MTDDGRWLVAGLGAFGLGAGVLRSMGSSVRTTLTSPPVEEAPESGFLKLRCIQSLFKSTYRKNAFSKGKIYEITLEDDYIWVRDNTGRPFNFARQSDGSSYVLWDYFETVRRKPKGSPVRTGLVPAYLSSDLSGPGVPAYLALVGDTMLNLEIQGTWESGSTLLRLNFGSEAERDAEAHRLAHVYHDLPVFTVANANRQFQEYLRANSTQGEEARVFGVPVRIFLSPNRVSIHAGLDELGNIRWKELWGRTFEYVLDPDGGSIQTATSRLNIAHKQMMRASIPIERARKFRVVLLEGLVVDGLQDQLKSWSTS